MGLGGSRGTGGGGGLGVRSTSVFRRGREGQGCCWGAELEEGVATVVEEEDPWGEGGTIPVGFSFTKGEPDLSRCSERLTDLPRKLGSCWTEGKESTFAYNYFGGVNLL